MSFQELHPRRQRRHAGRPRTRTVGALAIVWSAQYLRTAEAIAPGVTE